MSSSVNKILIIGGGFSGMAAAIQFRRQGVAVDIVEKNPNWRAYGAGISIGGATLRALQTLGLLEQFRQHGYVGDGLEIYDEHGNFLARLTTPPPAGADVPASGAIMRPVLSDIMAEACTAAGCHVRVGTTCTDIQLHADRVAVAFSDQTSDSYDLVIGADGLMSQTREQLFPGAPRPQFSGQGVWRAVFERPDHIRSTVLWHSEEKQMKIGVNPVSPTHMYLFLNDTRATNEFIPPEQQPELLREMMRRFDAPGVQALADQIGPDSQVLYRPLEGLLMPLPWHRGRVVLIGDAVHATTPHLAMGAGIGIEDAIVLAEEVAAHSDLEEALVAFEQRRWERCRLVVENSRRLGEIEMAGGDQREHARLMQESMIAIAAPI
ncbi:MAG: FAD-dependent oxidoreductase [Spongiibacteraceae bacterium]|jgi:2-polyprenyl-6-methoxyphenol hydroxylase-like FAD-dependent oxidoreductase|nr:FAD-dependent oxidoreductase [Spongiibacteraceae bacterium]